MSTAQQPEEHIYPYVCVSPRWSGNGHAYPDHSSCHLLLPCPIVILLSVSTVWPHKCLLFQYIFLYPQVFLTVIWCHLCISFHRDRSSTRIISSVEFVSPPVYKPSSQRRLFANRVPSTPNLKVYLSSLVPHNYKCSSEHP